MILYLLPLLQRVSKILKFFFAYGNPESNQDVRTIGYPCLLDLDIGNLLLLKNLINTQNTHIRVFTILSNPVSGRIIRNKEHLLQPEIKIQAFQLE